MDSSDAVILKALVNNNVKRYFETAKFEILNYAASGWLYNIAFDWEYLNENNQMLTPSLGKVKKIPRQALHETTHRPQKIEFSKIVKDLNKIHSPVERLKKLDQMNYQDDGNLLVDSFAKLKNMQLAKVQEISFKSGGLNIIIIGSGPCGLYLANALKFRLKEKINIVVIDNKCVGKHVKKPFSRRWLSHLPSKFFEPYFDANLYKLITGFGRNGFVGLPINVIEFLLFFSAKSLGVQFYFDHHFDFLMLNPDLVTFAVDASGGRLDNEFKTSNTSHQEIIELKHHFQDLDYAGVNQSINSPLVMYGKVDIKLKQLGSLYYPYVNEKPIVSYMVKLTSVPPKIKSNILDFIRKNNQKNQFYLWEGDLIDELNELLIIINLTEKEYLHISKQISKKLYLHDYIHICEQQRSQIGSELFEFLNTLDELDKKNKIYVEKPFVTKPSINLFPTTQTINDVHVYPVGDSLFKGNPKVGNALGSNLPIISDFVDYITRIL